MHSSVTHERKKAKGFFNKLENFGFSGSLALVVGMTLGSAAAFFGALFGLAAFSVGVIALAKVLTGVAAFSVALATGPVGVGVLVACLAITALSFTGLFLYHRHKNKKAARATVELTHQGQHESITDERKADRRRIPSSNPRFSFTRVHEALGNMKNSVDLLGKKSEQEEGVIPASPTGSIESTSTQPGSRPFSSSFIV